MYVLGLSKVFMYEFYCDYIKKYKEQQIKITIY